VTLQELTPGFLRGYGALSEAGAERITTVTRRLRDLLHEGAALLHEHDPGGLADRVARLPGAAGDILRAVETLSTTHYIEAIRPLLAAAVERAEDAVVTIGVFGRVSVGKSSLINALIGTSVLPVGVTPVTAVPIRVDHGDARAVVDFLSGEQRTVSTDMLAEYVTEQHNPNNTRGIRAVTVTVPTMLRDLRILDTPGVGSLSATGPAQTFAWLPRCDLGLVLVAPGTPVGRDELALVSGLLHAGIPCHVILSKADTVSDADASAAMTYITTQLRRVLGTTVSIPMTAVSTHPEHAAGLAQLRHDVVEPLARDHVQQRRRALAQRLDRLVTVAQDAVGCPTTARDVMEASAQDAHEQDAHEQDASAQKALAHDEPARDEPPPRRAEEVTTEHATTQAIRHITESLASAAATVLDDAATRVAEAWARGEDGRDAARAAILGATGDAVSHVREAAVSSDGQERVPPFFDPEWLDALPALAPPAFSPGPLRRTLAARRLAPLRPMLETALTRYANRLAAWGEARARQDTPTPRSSRAVPETRHQSCDVAPELFERLRTLVAQIADGVA
jgi:GTP-binding protein EngB required for normal cell division